MRKVIRKKDSYKQRYDLLVQAVRGFMVYQDEMEAGNAVDAEEHIRAYRKMKRIAKSYGGINEK